MRHNGGGEADKQFGQRFDAGKISDSCSDVKPLAGRAVIWGVGRLRHYQQDIRAGIHINVGGPVGVYGLLCYTARDRDSQQPRVDNEVLALLSTLPVVQKMDFTYSVNVGTKRGFAKFNKDLEEVHARYPGHLAYLLVAYDEEANPARGIWTPPSTAAKIAAAVASLHNAPGSEEGTEP